MNSDKGVIVQLMKNKHNNMYYKAVANSILFMWSPQAKAWIKPCTTYSEMMKSIDNYDLVDNKTASILAKTKFI